MRTFVFILFLASIVDAFVSKCVPILRQNKLQKSHFKTNMCSKNWNNKKVTNDKKPIPIISFDEMFMNVNNFKNAYISSNCDRIVFFFKNKTNGVYYIKEQDELSKIEHLLTSSNCNLKIIVDYQNAMDTPSGPLYCTPKYKTLTREEIDDILGKYLEERNEIDEMNELYETEDIDSWYLE